MASEVLRTSGGADAPAVVALRAPLRHFVVPSLIPSLRPSNKRVEEDREDPVLRASFCRIDFSLLPSKKNRHNFEWVFAGILIA